MLGYTAVEFAKMVNLSSSAYHKLETGKCPLTLDHFFKIAEALNIKTDKLFLKPL
jgi:DNA-binding XRE family transcriptional regulator